ncbi:hypothetical protein ASPACDRAFT_117419 [Aspergillus aculeatus ATCC 16872]|uniref:J domain-containing protein n=1 Tax=Aspergillus aculeatus (strain ATCC 16872 / CBS 172.66 / WB 5094) TaxID=690307 RepID=A0A1L9WXE8_ASPA1|nr:uncharacterized protein ASPACDRAFT_117419 [Aspergillus aculeatus ATCC 16872]OJK00871.1 hypothetical protein ASPACDRAFT_117419 [Aspergillus aculeatus ATCC 16872]
MPEPTDRTSCPTRPLNPHSPPSNPSSQDNQQQQPRRKRFRFKSPSRPSSKTKDKPNRTPKDPLEKETRHTAHRARRAHRNRHPHQPTPPTPDPASTPTTTFDLDPDTAFRESLFDALGDDEGATYWESVYGQPIHTYAIPSVPTGPSGELEQMDEEEYAAYVRSKMWERTREGMLEEQERLRAERHRKRQQEKQRQAGENTRKAFDEAIEASLRRGRERKREKAWREGWEAYLGCWGRLDGAVQVAAAAAGDRGGKGSFRNLVFWPVESGKRKDVSKENVEAFMRHSPQAANGSSELLAVLKAERVRWHPDKIQQRYGVLGIEEAVLRSVTEVFQIIDHLWNDLRTRDSA